MSKLGACPVDHLAGPFVPVCETWENWIRDIGRLLWWVAFGLCGARFPFLVC